MADSGLASSYTGTSSIASTGGATQQNPLARKLNKILETRLENDKVFWYSF